MRILLVLGLSVSLLSCHDKSDDAAAATILLSILESESNDTAPTANALSSSGAGRGTLATPGDVDCWSFGAAAGEMVEIGIHGVTLDQATWNAANAVPILSLLGPDGATELARHDLNLWAWGRQDLEVAGLRLSTTGTHFVRVATSTGGAGGAYALTVRRITAPTLQLESEPNDTTAVADPIVPGVVQGLHVDNESDFYALTISMPSIVRLELLTYRNGIQNGDDDYFDPVLRITDGVSILMSNDDTYFYDSAIEYQVGVPQTLFIEVLEAGGTGDAPYLLTVSVSGLDALVGSFAESEPNNTPAEATPVSYGQILEGDLPTGVDVDLFAFEGAAGDLIRVHLHDGDNLEAVNNQVDIQILAADGVSVLPADFDSNGLQTLKTLLTQSGRHYLRATTPSPGAPYTFEIKLLKRSQWESEANDSQFLADSLNTSALGAGLANTDGDVDMWRFTALRDELVTILIYAENPALANRSNGHAELDGHGSTLRPRLRLMSSAGVVVAEVRLPPTPINNTSAESVVHGLATNRLSFVAPATGEYFAIVSAENLPVSSTHYYVIEKK